MEVQTLKVKPMAVYAFAYDKEGMPINPMYVRIIQEFEDNTVRIESIGNYRIRKVVPKSLIRIIDGIATT